MVEDAVVWASHGVGGRFGFRQRSRIVGKVIGFAWVIAFLGWSTPAMMYPAARLNAGGGVHTLLPFSVVRMVMRMMSGAKG